MSHSSFLFTCCQIGAERALKNEIAANWPDLRFAFSRPGFVTFKNIGSPLATQFDLRSVFARTYGWTIGNVRAKTEGERIDSTCELLCALKFQHLHVWPRDAGIPGTKQFVPGPDANSTRIGECLADRLRSQNEKRLIQVNQRTAINSEVSDVIIVDEDHWAIGKHIAASAAQRFPAGTFIQPIPDNMVSRAYLKMAEAIKWSKMPIAPGDRFVEIGSAPGGSCQYLLDQELLVTGIDPSKMHESVLQHPNYTHIQKRGSDLRRTEYSPFRWLAIDTNVAPKHTLDTVENIVTHKAVHIRGLLITLKLPNWDLADQIHEFAKRVRSWGYKSVRCRQLSQNRQEICIAALKNRATRRFGKRSQKHTEQASTHKS